MALSSFRNSGLSVVNPTPFDIDFLVIGGGGAGGFAGGGGAGGYRCSVTGENSGELTSAMPKLIGIRGITYTVTVGAGGAAGSNGNASEILVGAYTGPRSLGGGRGGGSQETGYQGSSGGGGGSNATVGAIFLGGFGLFEQGFRGGTTNGEGGSPCGGGGGAGAVGANSSGAAGAGGTGIASSITGTSVTRGGGGGGGTFNTTAGAGGSGGGGAGAVGAAAGTSGTANTGGGGGGTSSGTRGAGGSGVVILRTADTVAEGATTGSPTVTTSGGFRIYVFNASGSIRWS